MWVNLLWLIVSLTLWYVVDDKLVIIVHIENLFFKIHILESAQAQNYFFDRVT